jgi:hypothetical protein
MRNIYGSVSAFLDAMHFLASRVSLEQFSLVSCPYGRSTTPMVKSKRQRLATCPIGYLVTVVRVCVFVPGLPFRVCAELRVVRVCVVLRRLLPRLSLVVYGWTLVPVGGTGCESFLRWFSQIFVV